MGQEPRKATDVLLDLESKVNILLDIVRSQDLNIKVLSNKLNEVMGQLKKQTAEAPKIVVEAVQNTPLPTIQLPPTFTHLPAGDPERNIPVVAESKLPQTDTPQGFRRTSRPESFAGDDVYLNRPGLEQRLPVQLPPQMPQTPPGRQGAPPPGRTQGDMVVPPPAPTTVTKHGNIVPQSSVQLPPQPSTAVPPQEAPSAGQVPVMQRVVDKNGKSIFLADVEITDLSTSQPIFKTRTNGTGKWFASLGIGAYQVVISKRASVSTSKEKLESVQNIQVDGSQSPFELPMLIIK